MASKIKQIEELMSLLEKSDLNELEMADGEFSVRLSKGGAMVAMQPMQQAAPTPAPAPVPVLPAAGEAAPAAPEASGYQLKSPMVGTFYRKPSPDAANYVEVGAAVNVGDTLCIIEAMKIMNQIEADKSGTVKAILLEDGAPVEFDQPLFIIE